MSLYFLYILQKSNTLKQVYFIEILGIKLKMNNDYQLKSIYKNLFEIIS